MVRWLHRHRTAVFFTDVAWPDLAVQMWECLAAGSGGAQAWLWWGGWKA